MAFSFETLITYPESSLKFNLIVNPKQVEYKFEFGSSTSQLMFPYGDWRDLWAMNSRAASFDATWISSQNHTNTEDIRNSDKYNSKYNIWKYVSDTNKSIWADSINYEISDSDNLNSPALSNIF